KSSKDWQHVDRIIECWCNWPCRHRLNLHHVCIVFKGNRIINKYVTVFEYMRDKLLSQAVELFRFQRCDDARCNWARFENFNRNYSECAGGLLVVVTELTVHIERRVVPTTHPCDTNFINELRLY